MEAACSVSSFRRTLARPCLPDATLQPKNDSLPSRCSHFTDGGDEVEESLDLLVELMASGDRVLKYAAGCALADLLVLVATHTPTDCSSRQGTGHPSVAAVAACRAVIASLASALLSEQEGCHEQGMWCGAVLEALLKRVRDLDTEACSLAEERGEGEGEGEGASSRTRVLRDMLQVRGRTPARCFAGTPPPWKQPMGKS